MIKEDGTAYCYTPNKLSLYINARINELHPKLTDDLGYTLK